MADDDDIPVLNEAENELDRVLLENGYDPAEFNQAEKQQLVDDMEGTTTGSASASGPDADNDRLSSAIPPEERDNDVGGI